jgi:allantoinase
VDVTCETCPHYLTFTDEDLLEVGALAKCAPPLRPAEAQERLWQRLFGGSIQFVASDHSPCPPEMKEGADFFRVWGGIAGAQHTLPLLLQEGHERRGLSLPALHRLLSLNVATRFRLPAAKGGLKIGGDADLVVVDLNGRTVVDPATALHRHPCTPYDGLSLQGLVVHTLVRGVPVSFEGKIISQPAGRLVKPAPAA